MEIRDEMILEHKEWEEAKNEYPWKVDGINIGKLVDFLQKGNFGFEANEGHRIVQYKESTDEGVQTETIRIPLYARLVDCIVKNHQGENIGAGEEIELFLSTKYPLLSDKYRTEPNKTLELKLSNHNGNGNRGICCSIRFKGEEDPDMILTTIAGLKKAVIKAMKMHYKGKL